MGDHRIYYWLFFRASTNASARWMWRKWVALLAIGKHVRRGNCRQVAVWTRWLVKPMI